MLDLNDLRYFVEAVDRGGFSAAARELKRPTSTVSYRIQHLERELGLTLFVRRSRRATATRAGDEFYYYARSVMERAKEAEAVMRSRSSEPTGQVLYSVSMAEAQFAMPDMLLSFMAHYPRIEPIQHVTNATAGIVADRYDLTIQAHSRPLQDSELVQRRLAEVPCYLFASPEYIQRVGELTTPQDLAKCRTLLMRHERSIQTLDLQEEHNLTRVTRVALQPKALAVCMVTLKRAAEAGLGIASLPAYVARQEVRSGTLRRVLRGWVSEINKITALMSHRKGMAAATRLFIDHIAEEFPIAVKAESDDADQ